MNTNKNKVSAPQEFTLYLPKKARNNAIVDLGPGLSFDLIKEMYPDKYNDMIQKFKEDPPEGMVFVDIYKDNIIYFECYKAIENVKKFTRTQKGFDICIRKIVISDIDNVVATPFNEELIHEPYYSFEQYTNYPATHTFDNPI